MLDLCPTMKYLTACNNKNKNVPMCVCNIAANLENYNSLGVNCSMFCRMLGYSVNKGLKQKPLSLLVIHFYMATLLG